MLNWKSRAHVQTRSDTVLVSDPAFTVSDPDLEAETRQKEAPTRIHKTIVPVGQQPVHESEMLKFFAAYSQTRSMSLKSTEEAPVQKQGHSMKNNGPTKMSIISIMSQANHSCLNEYFSI